MYSCKRLAFGKYESCGPDHMVTQKWILYTLSLCGTKIQKPIENAQFKDNQVMSNVSPRINSSGDRHNDLHIWPARNTTKPDCWLFCQFGCRKTTISLEDSPSRFMNYCDLHLRSNGTVRFIFDFVVSHQTLLTQRSTPPTILYRIVLAIKPVFLLISLKSVCLLFQLFDCIEKARSPIVCGWKVWFYCHTCTAFVNSCQISCLVSMFIWSLDLWQR